MKLISWNVNGLRACAGKGFFDFFKAEDADIFCLGETKMQPDQADFDFAGYHQYWNSAEKKGYSGVAVFTKAEPLRVCYGLGIDLDYRMQWEDDFRAYVCALDQKKPVIICGDMNVAHQEIDLKNPKTNRRNAGFTDEERQKMTELLAAGFTDTFRAQNPDATGIYSWWSYRFKAREKNAGWRIDYFLVSNRLMEKVTGTKIYTEVMGSDHCPVGLEISL